MTIAAAGDYYLDAVCPENALIDKSNVAIKTFNKNPSGNSILPLAKIAAKIAKADRTQADALKNPTLPWPVSAADDVKKVASYNLAELGYYQAAEEATTLSDYNSALTGLPTKDSGAQAVRDDLRLPTNTKTSCYGHPGYTDKKPKATPTTGTLTSADKVIGTYPTGYPKIVKVSTLPGYLKAQFAGDTQAIAVASGVYIGAKPGLAEQQVLDSQTITGLCADVKAYTKSFTNGAQYPGTCFTKVMVTPAPKS